MVNQLEIRNLHARIVDGETILNGVNLVLPKGQVHAIMGPNGAGKSTLGKIIAGDPSYEITKGDILMDGESILEMEADERARKGLFLASSTRWRFRGFPTPTFCAWPCRPKKVAKLT